MLQTYQKALRKDQTAVEAFLWQHLRNRRFCDFKFRRQHILQGYIVDFVCLQKKLIIELDGSQHLEERLAYDDIRTSKLEHEGFKVLRFWNNDLLKNTEAVLEVIYNALVGESA